MVSDEEFEALKKRLSDLEQVVSEIPKALQGMMGAFKATAELSDSLPGILAKLDLLATAVTQIQKRLDFNTPVN
jgi:hypothetical protein